MYCSSCGAAVAQNLTYCSRCGAKVNGAKAGRVKKSSESAPEPLVNAVVAVFVVGLGAIVGLMAVMKKVVGFDQDTILAITVFSLALMLVVEGVLIRLLLRGKREGKEGGDTRPMGEIRGSQARLLAVEPSVTEHTTRSLETVSGELRPE